MSSALSDSRGDLPSASWIRMAVAVACGALMALPSRATAQPTPLDEPLAAEVQEDSEGSDEDVADDDGADDATDADSRDADSRDADSRDEPVLPFVPTEPSTYPIAHTRRPLNLPRFNARAGGGLRVCHFDDETRALTNQDTSLSLSIGGSFAVTDWLELGVLDERIGMRHPVIGGGVIPQGLFALALTPDVEFGDIPVHARVRVVADPAFDVSIDVGVVFPVNGDWALFGATVVRARLTERFTMDSGLEVALRFGRVDNDPHLDLFVPFSALVQLHPSVFVAARTGVRWVDFDDLAFPLGFELGYTIANAERPLMDVTLGFGFPALLTPNETDKAQEDVWQVTLAGYAYFAL